MRVGSAARRTPGSPPVRAARRNGSGMSDVLDEMEALADRLDAVGFAGQPGLGDDLVRYERAMARFDAHRLRLTRAFDASREWAVDGSRSAGQWTASHCHQK